MGAGPLAPSSEQADKLRNGLDAACGEAARLISQADVLLLCTGAGFSADSGLAIYADVAKVKAYADRGLQYHDICQPRWLRENPELFWGFWGQCYNDYRDTAPHEGYEIINTWVEERFRHSSTAAAIRERLELQKKAARLEAENGFGAAHGMEFLMGEEEAPHEGKLGPYEVKDYAGAFFVFTSNVDAHHFDWFHACEIRECHGNTEIYQCADADADFHPQPVWRIPMDFRFRVDKDSMLAPRKVGEEPRTPSIGQASPPAVVDEDSDDAYWNRQAAAAGPPAAAGDPAARSPEITDAPPAEAADAAAEQPAAAVDAAAEQPVAAEAPEEEQPLAADAAEAVESNERQEEVAPAAEEAAAEVEAPREAEGNESQAEEAPQVEEEGSPSKEPVAHVGRVLGVERTTTLRHMPQAPPWTDYKGFSSNHPTCPFCGGKARPAILMFGDMEWQDVAAQSKQWTEWRRAVRLHCQEAEQLSRDRVRVVVLEIGAGGNVTTVRNTSEQQMRAFLQAGAAVHLVRVNPEYPFGDEEDFSPDGDSEERVVSVMARGLDSIHRMERAMAAIRKKEAEEKAAEALEAEQQQQPPPAG